MRTDSKYLKIILALSLFGVLISGWLLSMHVKFATGQASLTESCGLIPGIGGQGCAAIAVSDFSVIFGVPLAALALGFYITLLLLSFWAMRNYQKAYEPLHIAFALSSFSILVTFVMTFISTRIVKDFCFGCSLLWLTNLALWPCFVKQLGLRWGNALGAHSELLFSKTLNRSRLMACSSVALAVFAIFSIIGASAKALSGQESRMGNSNIVQEYESSPIVFLGKEAYGGDQAKGLLSGDPVMEILEFSDFQCPACRMAAQFFKPFVLKNKNEVRFTYRHFPLDGGCNRLVPNGRHNFACIAAKASICAAKEGKFWPLHDSIFDRQEDLSASLIMELVDQHGLDRAKIEACMNSEATLAQISKEIDWADAVQLQSTPTLVINGRKLTGARSPQDLELLLAHLRKQTKK
jgi:protein-disulfide isomerase/uncharacterized membrane protein